MAVCYLTSVLFVTNSVLIVCFIHTEPTKPVINVPDSGRDIPVGDGSPVTMNVGDNVTAASNTTIAIRCPVSGVPRPSVNWQRDDIQITEGDRFSISDDNTLVIKGAVVQQSSKYTCSVQSVFGQDDASSIVRIIGTYEYMVKSYEPSGPLLPGLIPVFCSMKRLGVLLVLLDGMLVHRR